MKHLVDTSIWIAVVALTVAAGWLALMIGDLNREFWDSLR